MRFVVHESAVLDHLATVADNTFDAVVSDVPYGLGSQPTPEEIVAFIQGAELKTGDFMGKNWSVPSVHTWKEIHRVLKPGGHVLAFAGSRTADLITIGARMADFEVRDVIMWVYAQGMPKSQNTSKEIDRKAGAKRKVVGSRTLTGSAAIGTKEKGGTFAAGTSSAGRAKVVVVTAPSTELAKQWDGYGTGLAPSYEPIILARKPMDGIMADNVAKWGVGPIWIDGCRIEASGRPLREVTGALPRPNCYASARGGGSFAAGKTDLGRWPANICLDEEAGRLLDVQSGDRPGMSGGGMHREGYAGGMFGGIDSSATARNDNGGASRFFFCPKVSKAERELGCEAFEPRTIKECVGRDEDSVGANNGRAGAGRTTGSRNDGPCLKPVALTRWLATMLLPPARSDGSPRRILVPYCGTGSEAVGAILAGWDEVFGVEFDAHYAALARARCQLAVDRPKAWDPDVEKGEEPLPGQTSLFGVGAGGGK